VSKEDLWSAFISEKMDKRSRAIIKACKEENAKLELCFMTKGSLFFDNCKVGVSRLVETVRHSGSNTMALGREGCVP